VDNRRPGVVPKKNPALRRDFPQHVRTRSLTPLALLPRLVARILLLLAGLLTTALLLLTRLLPRVLALLAGVLVRIVLVRHVGFSLR
jgi:hypothetical protein